MTTFLADEAATIDFARTLHEALPEDLGGWTVLLEGQRGAGKSTLARALIRSLGHDGAIPSPTYTLVEPYSLGRNTVYHVDLYRVSDEEELRFLGWNELDEGFRIVEWPDRAPALTAGADLRIGLDYENAGRNVTVTGLSERGEALAKCLNS